MKVHPKNLSFCTKVIIKTITYSNSIQNAILLINSLGFEIGRKWKDL